jgi:hypothetical protein
MSIYLTMKKIMKNNDSSRMFPLSCSLALILALPATVHATPSGEGTPPPACVSHQYNIKERLKALRASQAPDGDLAFHGPDSLLADFPLLATISLHVYRHSPDMEFLKDAHGMVSSYIGHLLSQYDADGDFLLELSTGRFEGDGQGRLEDVGFNTLLALDMLSLSRIYTELRMPIDALYWYEGTRAVGRNVVDETYDQGAGFFLPINDVGSRVNAYRALSMLPVHFNRFLGDNTTTAVIKNYLLKNQYLSPEVPFHYVDWDASPQALDHTAPENLFRTMLLLGSLEWNGMHQHAVRFRTAIETRLEARPAENEVVPDDDAVYGRYIACLIANESYRTFFPRYHELVLLESIIATHNILEPGDVTRYRQCLDVLRRYAASKGVMMIGEPSGDTAPGGTVVEDAIRGVYLTISATREKWKKRSLFMPRELSRIPGFDLYGAFQRLTDDILQTLHELEDFVFEDSAAEAGLNVTATLMNELLSPGEPARIKIGVSAMRDPLTVRSLVVFYDQRVDTLTSPSSPITLSAGEPAAEFWHRMTPNSDRVSVIAPLRFGVEARMTDGRKLRGYFNKGVYITKPVKFAVTFPRGKIMQGGTVPIEILVTKNVPYRTVINAEWYSPAGLRLKEGRSIEMFLPESVDTSTMRLDVLVPTPCRPGSFPFVIKLFANGQEEGTVMSSLFKHYQWIFVGPFPKGSRGLDTPYAPEQRVDLFESFTGLKEAVSWRELPRTAYGSDGAVDLNSLLPGGGTGYLYSVVETPSDRRTSMSFASAAPALLIVNGEKLLRSDSGFGELDRTTLVLQKGLNNILIKILARPPGSATLFYQLGDEEDLTSDEFNNNLWELIDGYKSFHERSLTQFTDEGEVQRVVTLRYQDPSAYSVAVVGSFNGWSPTGSSMRKRKGGKWEISLHLPIGRHVYRFLINNSEQVLDPLCPQQEPDGYGGRNSVLYVQ